MVVLEINSQRSSKRSKRGWRDSCWNEIPTQDKHPTHHKEDWTVKLTLLNPIAQFLYHFPYDGKATGRRLFQTSSVCFIFPFLPLQGFRYYKMKKLYERFFYGSIYICAFRTLGGAPTQALSVFYKHIHWFQDFLLFHICEAC